VRRRFWPALLLLTGCAGRQQSALDSGGAPAAGIERLWWLFFWLLLAIFAIVMVILGGSIARRHRGIEQEPLEGTHKPSAPTERKLGAWVTGASIVTTLILLVLIAVSVSAGKSTAGHSKADLTVEVVGNQWWWYVRYLNNDASRIVVTANELHIPVGRSVLIRGTSNDVIHSFWVPSLQGKRDLIPSRVTTEWIQADRPGRFRGQCAEFCGLQHAHMALWTIAEPPDEFEAWFNAQLQPAAQPVTPDAERGRQVFLTHGCVLCHNITGTAAAGQVAPDLTHVGSRLTIAAGTLPNNRGNMAGWISDPQTIKPGNHMATIPIAAPDLEPLAEYLETLR
jgi:cytochrome c oxidase subunit II